MRLSLWAAGLALLAVSGGGCKLFPNVSSFLPDGGGANNAEMEFEQMMGDPTPLTQGGTKTWGQLTVETIFHTPSPEVTRTVSIGGKLLETYDYPNGDDSDVTGEGDINGDGTTDWLYTSKYDGTAIVTTTELSDTDFDGTYDRLDEWIVDVSKGVPFNKTETVSRYLNPDGTVAQGDSGLWVQQWTSSGPAIANCGVLEEGQDGFPDLTNYTGDYVKVGGASGVTKIKIVHDNHYPGACNDEETGRLVAAIQASLEDIKDCLCTIPLNAHLASKVLQAVQIRPLVIGCGNDCDGVAASTDLPYSTGSFVSTFAFIQTQTLGFQRLNVNKAYVDNQRIIPIEGYILHELIHFSGVDHNPAPAGNPEGHDMVYGCGRYCVRGGLQGGHVAQGGCQLPNWTTGWTDHNDISPAEYAFDCADCADDDHRFMCGVGLADITECSKDDCLINPSLVGCDDCCEEFLLNCWGDQVETSPGSKDIGGRDKHLKPHQADACLHDGSICPGTGVDQPVGICEVKDAVCLTCQAPTKVPTPCLQWPVGWCLPR
jgi:hypothetical protein